MRELRYDTITDVIESWERLRRVKDYEKIAGVRVFRRLFEYCPKVKLLFGFPMNIDPNSYEVITSKRFIMHATYIIQMIDTALSLLGPDIEVLTEIFYELGEKHYRYGVTPDMFPILGDALLTTIEEILDEDDFTPLVKKSWKLTFDALSKTMIRALKRKQQQKQQKRDGVDASITSGATENS